MKKITTLILLFICIISFGQNIEEKKAHTLFKEKKYAEANMVYEQLLNKEYGELNEALQYTSLTMSANCYYVLKDFKKAYDKYKKVLKFLKTTNLEITDKDSVVSKFTRFMESSEIQFSNSINSTSDLKIASESNSTPKTDNSESKVAETTRPTLDDKTVTLKVSGTGKTLEEAKTNALRSAIEQAFGTFISSKTEILNDNLVKDEIVSVSNGNIQKFDIISQIEIPNNGFAITLNVTVSINKLTSFIESKGGVAEFNGSLLSYNLKVKEIAKNSELIAFNNLIPTFKQYLNNCIDYNISLISENPKMSENDVVLRLKVESKFNENIDEFVKFFTQTLRSLSLNLSNVNEYDKLNMPMYSLFISPVYSKEINNKGKEKKKIIEGLFIFRNEETQKQIVKLLDFNTLAFNFEIDNGIKKTNGNSTFNSFKKVLQFDRHGDYSYPYKPLYFHDGISLNTRVLTSKEGSTSNKNPYFEFEDKMYFFNNVSRRGTNGIIMGYNYFKKIEDLRTVVDREHTNVEKDWAIANYSNTYVKYNIFEDNKSVKPILIDFENLKTNNKVFTLIIDDYFPKDKLDYIKDYKINKINN